MKVVFFGDLVAPEEIDIEIIKNFLKETNLFKDKIVIGNLEGLIVNGEKYNNALYNDIHVIDLFKDSYKTILSLANNHIKDIPEKFDNTIEILKKNEIGFSGAKLKEKEGCLNPYEFEINGTKFAVFNHCWDVMSIIMKSKSKDIIVEDRVYEKFIQEIIEYKKQNENVKIIVYFHWNFDFEKLPFPSHRIIARKLIDNGVEIVVGSHSHLVNGGEIYKGKPIIYGLGNFYIPNKKFFGGRLVYPEESRTSLVLEFDIEKEEIVLYWIKYDETNKKMQIVEKEKMQNGIKIKKYSPYIEMNEKEYKKYFKKNRVKNKCVPIWYNEKDNLENHVKNKIIIFRMKLFRFIQKILNKMIRSNK